MNRKKIKLNVNMLIAFGLLLGAQMVVSQQMVEIQSPKDVVRLATDGHPSLKADVARIESSSSSERAYSWLGTTSATYTREGIGEGTDFNEQKIEVSQLFHWPGYVRAQRAVAQSKTELTRATATLNRRMILMRVKSAYLALLAAQSAEKVLSGQKDIVARLNEIAKRKFEVGEIAEWDVTKTRIELQNAEMAWENAIKNVDIASSGLREAAGLIGPENWVVSDSLSYQPFGIDFDELEELLQSHPELAQMGASAEVSRSIERAVKNRAYPDLVVAYMRQDFGNGFDRNGVVIGAQFQLDGSSRRAMARAERLDYQAITLERDAAMASLTSAFDSARASFLAAETSLNRFLSEQIPDVDRVLSNAEQAYAMGDLDLVDVFDVRRSLLQHQLSGIELLRGYYSSILQIENVSGKTFWE